MPNFVTETTDESFFSRIKNAIFGVFAGLVMVPLSIGLIFWNEYRTIKETHRLEKAQSLCVSDVSVDKVDSQLNGKLVHVKGTVHSAEHLNDQEFGVDFSGISLKRNVQTFQWVEHKETKSRKKLGGGRRRETTYKYEQEWVSNPVDSSDFHSQEGHENLPATFRDARDSARAPSLGAFRFPNRLISSLSGGKNIRVKNEDLQKLNIDQDKENMIVFQGGFYYSPTGKPNPSSPKNGDQKITFSGLQDAPVTLISEQASDSFQPMQLGSGWSAFELIENGNLSSEEVFQRAHNANAMWKWILRVGSFVLMWIGFGMIMKPISTLGDVVPFIGSIIGFGTWLIAFLLAAIISLTSFAIAWFAVRPFLSGIILLVVGLIFFAIYRMRSKPTPPSKELGVELMN